MPAPPPRRHALRLSLRLLLAFVALVGLGLGSWGAAARAQRDAVAGLLAIDPGAVIEYDVDSLGCVIDAPGSPFYVSPDDAPLPWYVPRWAYRQLGRDYFRTATVALVDGPEGPTPEQRSELVGHLARLRHLKFVTVHAPVEDADVARLAHLAGLKDLRFPNPGPALTDRSLATIGGFGRLEALEIGASAITDAGVAGLGHLPRLNELELGIPESEPNPTDSGVLMTGRVPAGAGRFPALAWLNVRCRVPESGGLGLLGSMPALELLRLSGPSIRDDDLRPLAHLPALVDLHLEDTAVTASGLEQFRGASRLRSLDVSPAVRGDRAHLAAILPGCNLNSSIDQR